MADAATLANNKQVALRFVERMEAQDPDGAADLFGEDLEAWSPRSGTRGKNEYVDLLRWGHTTLFSRGIHYDIGTLTAEDDRVALPMHGSAILPDGTHYENDYHFYFEIRDGLIRVLREYTDSSQVQAFIDTLRTGEPLP